MAELAKYKAMAAEIKTECDKLQAELIAFMETENLESLQGIEHKASYKKVVSNRIDTKALKLDLPEICDKYTKQSESMRFNFS